MKSVLKDAASTTGTAASGLGNTAANVASGLGNTTADLASGLGNTAANVASGGGRLPSGVGSNLPSSSQTATGAPLYQSTGQGYQTSTGPGLSTFQSQSGQGYQSTGQGYQSTGQGYQSTGQGYQTYEPGVSTFQPSTGQGFQSSSSGPGFRTSGQVYQQQPTETFYAPSVTREHIDKPTIVRETVLPQEKIEVQPVIHREREQLEVHEVVQPMHERDINPTLVKHATLPAQTRPDVRETDTQFQNLYREASSKYSSESHTEPVMREFLNKPAIIEEHISKKIVEEVQPVLYKETVAPVLIEETQPIYERIVEAPTIVEEMRQTVELGTKIQPLSSQMENLNIKELPAIPQQPTGFQRETYVTKEYIPAEDLSKAERAQVETKRNV